MTGWPPGVPTLRELAILCSFNCSCSDFTCPACSFADCSCVKGSCANFSCRNRLGEHMLYVPSFLVPTSRALTCIPQTCANPVILGVAKAIHRLWCCRHGGVWEDHSDAAPSAAPFQAPLSPICGQPRPGSHPRAVLPKHRHQGYGTGCVYGALLPPPLTI